MIIAKVRPMVSRGTHLLVNFEKAIMKEFGHYLSKHPYRLESSKHLVTELRKIDWKDGDNTLHKFDVEALYPNTNMAKAIGLMRKRIIEEKNTNQQKSSRHDQ